MAISSLVRARGLGGLAPGLAAVVLLMVVGGCHGGAAGGRPTDAGFDAGVDLMEKLPPPDAKCSSDGPGGLGCPLNFCGAPKSVAALAVGAYAELGADAVCTPGYACVPDGPTASGDALQLRCVAPLGSAVAFGAACGKGAGAANRCKNDALCIDGAPVAGAFCSALCRTDSDCAKDAYCLEYKSDTLPNKSYVNLGFCTPKEKIGATVCTREADCPSDQGCALYGGRTSLMTCQKLGGTKSVGAKCSKSTECRSGQCVDRDGHFDANESYCVGPCLKNSDCGADQRCTPLVVNNNGTVADPRDDVVIGICEPLFVSMAQLGCKKDSDCAAGRTCATKYGLCFTAGAASGAPCQASEDCELGATCNEKIDQMGRGYCQTLGCAPGAAAGTVDGCPGKALCAQQGFDRPLYACYEGCAQSGDCSRFTQSYLCQQLVTTDGGAPANDAGSAATDAAASDAGADAPEAGPLTGICLYNKGA